MHSPYRNGGETDGGKEQEDQVSETAGRCAAAKNKQGGIGAKNGHEDGSDEDAGFGADGDGASVVGVPLGELDLVWDMSASCLVIVNLAGAAS